MMLNKMQQIEMYLFKILDYKGKLEQVDIQSCIYEIEVPYHYVEEFLDKCQELEILDENLKIIPSDKGQTCT